MRPPGMHVGRAGGLAQLVEHLHGMQGVRSSSLLSSTFREPATAGFSIGSACYARHLHVG